MWDLDPERSLYEIRSVICVVLLIIRHATDALPWNCFPAQHGVDSKAFVADNRHECHSRRRGGHIGVTTPNVKVVRERFSHLGAD